MAPNPPHALPGKRWSEPDEGRSTHQPGTREQILDVALRLFSTKGYEATSIREISEELGLTKAALYYHFKNKEDIFMALHLRLHALTYEAITSIDFRETSPEAWIDMLDRLIDTAMEHYDLFLLQERNHVLLEKVHVPHDTSHGDVEQYFRAAVANEKIPLVDRMRMAYAYKAVMGVLDLIGNEFADAPTDQLAALLREATHSLAMSGRGASKAQRTRKAGGATPAARQSRTPTGRPGRTSRQVS